MTKVYPFQNAINYGNRSVMSPQWGRFGAAAGTLQFLVAHSQCRAARLRRLRSVAHVPPQFAMVVCLPSQASVGKLPGSLGFHAACLAHWARRHSAPGTPGSRLRMRTKNVPARGTFWCAFRDSNPGHPD